MHKIKRISRASFEIKERPDLLPVKARFWIASFGVALAVSISIFKDSTYYQTTAVGLFLGIFGAGILYWKTIISDEESGGIFHQIAKEGNSRRLSETELNSVLWFFQICSLEFICFATLFVYQLRHGRILSPTKIFQMLVLLSFASFAPMMLAYTLTKFIKIGRYKNASKMKNAD